MLLLVTFEGVCYSWLPLEEDTDPAAPEVMSYLLTLWHISIGTHHLPKTQFHQASAKNPHYLQCEDYYTDKTWS